MTVTLLRYAEHMDQIRQKIEPAALDKLQYIKVAAEREGLNVVGPYDMCDDFYRWSMLITGPGQPQDTGIDVTLQIAEQREFDGDDTWGINFGIMIVEYGGLIVGEYQPFNFTPQVWVDSRVPAEIDERWMYMDSVNVDDVVLLITTRFEHNRSLQETEGRSQ